MMNDPRDPFVLTRSKLFVYGSVLSGVIGLLIWFYVPKAPRNLARQTSFTEKGMPYGGDSKVAAETPAAAVAVAGQAMELYTRFCQQCHGAEGAADTPMARMMSVKVPNLAKGPFSYSRDPNEIAKLIRTGSASKAMPSFAKEITEEQALEIAKFAVALEKPADANEIAK